MAADLGYDHGMSTRTSIDRRYAFYTWAGATLKRAGRSIARRFLWSLVVAILAGMGTWAAQQIINATHPGFVPPTSFSITH